MSLLFAEDSSKSVEEFTRQLRCNAALRRGEDPIESEARFQVERAERERLAPILAEEAALRYLRPRSTHEDRRAGRVYDKYYRRTVESVPMVPEETIAGQDIIGAVAQWANWKYGDLGRADLRQEIELEALLLERDSRPETGRDTDGTWTHPAYVTASLKNRVRDYVRAELKRKDSVVPVGEIEFREPVEDVYADVLLEDDQFDHGSLKEGLLLVILSPLDLPELLRLRLFQLRGSLSRAEDKSLVHWAVAEYVNSTAGMPKLRVPESTRRSVNRLVAKNLPAINEMF